MKIDKNKAFTLLEIMVSVSVLVVVLLGLLSGYINCLNINEMSRSTTIAQEDARRIVEAMRALAVSSLTDITGTDWTAWAQNNGLNSLSSEQVAATYTDLDGTGDALDDDPLCVTVIVSWLDKVRPRSLIFGTLITVR